MINRRSSVYASHEVILAAFITAFSRFLCIASSRYNIEHALFVVDGLQSFHKLAVDEEFFYVFGGS